MEIYFLGYIIIPLAIIFFIYNPVKLYELTIFSIPFTGTALFQISNEAFAIEGIRPSMFLGSLCLLRYIITSISRRTIQIKKGLHSLFIPLFTLVIIACCSLIMPIIINGDLYVLNAHEVSIYFAEPKPLSFSFQYVTQFIYLLFGCLLAYYFAIKNNNSEKIKRSIQIYLYATLFVCCWGILEFALFYMDIPYPSFIFNSNHKSMSFGGTAIQAETGRPRISSVTLEPSILSQQLLTALPFLFWQVWEKRKYLPKPNARVLLFLILMILLISTADSAWLGLFIFVVVIVTYYLQRKKINHRIFAIMVVGMLAAIAASPFVIYGLSGKLSSYSGIERFMAYTEGWAYFIQYPILGIGWGVFPVWDLVICIAAATGILGLFSFLWLLRAIYLNFSRLKQSGNYTIANRSVWHSFIMLLGVSQASGFIYHSQFFWFVLGLTMAASVTKIEDQ